MKCNVAGCKRIDAHNHDAPPTRAEWARQQFTREQWLTERLGELCDVIEGYKLKIPWPIRVTCGWPGVAPGGRTDCVKGVTYDAQCSADKTREIFISPMISDGFEAFSVLAHEAVHAILPTDAQHGEAYLAAADRIGLTAGEPEQRLPGDDLAAWMRGVLANREQYPHARLEPPPLQPGHVIVVRVNDKGETTTSDVPEGGAGDPGGGAGATGHGGEGGEASGPVIGVSAVQTRTEVVGAGEVIKLKCLNHAPIIYMRFQDVARGTPRCACGAEYQVQA